METKRKLKGPLIAAASTAAAILVLAAALILIPSLAPSREDPQVITTSTLRQIINVSELSTFTAVYNGIAEVSNPEKPGEIDYYVSYKAKVLAGIDFEAVEVDVDNDRKLVSITVPDVRINDVVVDIASLAYIFLNDDANASTVSQQAYRACEDDARAESEKQEAIVDLARQNAQNVLTALVRPLVEQADGGYDLIVE